MPRKGMNQWGWTDMEELLQCPVCLDIPGKGVVEQCRHGHHICASCKTQVESCPLCKCDFHGTRNFVIEELLRHFDVLKNTMLLNNIVNETKTKKKAKRKLNASAPIFVPSPPERKVTTPNSTKGLYPCRVANCTAIFSAGRLLNHVRTCHADVLTESVVDFTDNYNQVWEIPYKTKKSINTNSFVIFVRGIGLIFLTVETLRSGQMIAGVQMAAKFKQAQNYLACIEFLGNEIVHSYNTRIISVRDTIQAMMHRRICFTLNKQQLKNICENKKFQCRLRLSRYNNLDSGMLTVPNVEEINVITGLRASLIQEENDKKLLKDLEVIAGRSNSGNSSNNLTNGSVPANQPQNNIEHQEQALANALRIVNAPRQSSSNTSREPINVTVAPPTELRTEPIAGRRRNRNRRRRNAMNGTTRPAM